MKIFTTAQVRDLDSYTIQHEPIASIDLMERAAMAFIKAFMRRVDSSREVIVVCGPGNNGGDGLAIARLLTLRHYSVKVEVLSFGKGNSDDFQVNYNRLSGLNVPVHICRSEDDLLVFPGGVVIIDAIFGSGLTRPASGLPLAAIRKINASGNMLVSVDIPSGLKGEDNEGIPEDAIVHANYTFSFEFPFLSFFFAENDSYTGKWRILPIGIHPGAIAGSVSAYTWMDKGMIAAILRDRARHAHKGDFGHALLVAGSAGMTGAAILAAKACLRSGSGLVSVHLPSDVYPVMQAAVPEAIVDVDESQGTISHLPDISKYTAVGIGPGLRVCASTEKVLHQLLEDAERPLVLDADALNILVAHPEWLEKLPANSILTPHPGEFDRLFGSSTSGYARHQLQQKMTEKLGVIIVLKGAYTMITTPGGHTWINSTGNAGMATGGSGDVLTGMITSFLAQGYSPEHAAVLGVYLHGLAADLALDTESEESLLPSDIIAHLGKAFKFVRGRKH